jgi:hypothetical protein
MEMDDVDIRPAMSAVAVLLLAGCGSSGGDVPREDTVLSGSFQGGSVIGLQYRTPTRQGATDSSGTFRYLAGETVTFSIGAVELGSAPGASTVTLFTLAGVMPPTTESELRRELRRATNAVTPFVRAINLARLLLVLDSDNDTANGIDLRGREGALANVTVNFDTPVRPFSATVDALLPNLPQNLPAWAPVVHLYRSLNIVVPAHVTVRTESTGGTLAPGVVGVSTSTYGSNGLLQTRNADADGNGMNESETLLTYDSAGRGLSTNDLWRDFLPLAYRQISNTTYDVLGNAVGNLYTLDFGDDGAIDTRIALASSFDAFGRLLTAVQVNDGSNGLDSRGTQTFTYNARGNPLTNLNLIDSADDGDIDERIQESFTYDAQDRLTGHLREEDYNADGLVDSRQTLTVAWGADGREVTQVSALDQDADGMAVFTSRTTWSYDAAARLSSIFRETDVDGDGTVDSRERATMTHDAEGREIRNVQSQDFNGDGVDNETVVLTRAYDANGNQTSFVEESDYDVDGVPDIRYATISTFGNNGEPLEIRYETDLGANGTVENSARSVNTNTLLDAGVARLAQEFLGGNGNYPSLGL